MGNVEAVREGLALARDIMAFMREVLTPFIVELVNALKTGIKEDV